MAESYLNQAPKWCIILHHIWKYGGYLSYQAKMRSYARADLAFLKGGSIIEGGGGGVKDFLMGVTM